MALRLYNTLSRTKQLFEPINSQSIGIYACGPTVYDRIHVGNARPLIVFDILVRLLRRLYPNVTYVRNITDVDDKINARAFERQISIDALCSETIAQYKADAEALYVLEPYVEPRATHHISEMIAMIEELIAKGHAYAAEGHVLFSVATMAGYGGLSGRSMDDMIAGARVEVAPYKKDPADFVLWKPSEAGQPGWDSPWGEGRPGWHIECSAMSAAYLGEVFDIHAGGLDLIFPHHENEIAQSVCAHDTDIMARYWMHNGYVTVDGEKMSKSLGNFTTVHEALEKHRGEAVRYALMSSHYAAPIDYSDQSVEDAKSALDRLYRAANDAAPTDVDADFQAALEDDLNIPLALSRLHALAKAANKGDVSASGALRASANLLGLLVVSLDEWQKAAAEASEISDVEIEDKIKQRSEARANRDFATADAVRDQLAALGVELLDGPDGTSWQRR